MAKAYRMRLALSGLASGLVLLTVASEGAEAQRYQRGYEYGEGFVVAESRFGKGSVEGAVRMGRVGPQVRLPRGTWIDCERSCSETLRRATVDFWESNGPQSQDSGRGYFSWGFGRRGY